MRSLVSVTLLLAAFGSAPAFAAGGMGDPSTVLRMHNAICEAQRRGEGPLYPNLCLPEYPAVPDSAPERRRPK